MLGVAAIGQAGQSRWPVACQDSLCPAFRLACTCGLDVSRASGQGSGVMGALDSRWKMEPKRISLTTQRWRCGPEHQLSEEPVRCGDSCDNRQCMHWQFLAIAPAMYEAV